MEQNHIESPNMLACACDANAFVRNEEDPVKAGVANPDKA
jgi:hypothetical protein